MRRRLIPLGSALLLVLASAVHADPRELRLDNGLRVLLDPDPQAVGVDVGVWYATGPVDEPAGRSGVTHLMERLMFRGSPKFAAGDYAKRVGEAGGTFNTFLAPDFCEFYSTAPAEGLGTLLQLEADRMAGQRLTAANVAAESRALADEQKRLDANPVTRGLQQLYALSFGAHPYAIPLQGRQADHLRLTPVACAEYAKTRLVPGNALVTVVGRFDPDSAAATIRRTFGAIPRRPVLAGRVMAPPPAGGHRGRVSAPGRLLLAGWRAPADSSCGAELAVIAQLLGAGNAPRLGSSLVDDKQLALTTSCVFDGRRRASLLYATAFPATEADSATIESALVAEVEKFASEPISDADLAGARKALILAARVDRQSVRGRAQALGAAAMTDGDWRDASRRIERLEKLTPADVQHVAKEVLVSDRRAIVWAVPGTAPPAPARTATTKKGGRS